MSSPSPFPSFSSPSPSPYASLSLPPLLLLLLLQRNCKRPMRVTESKLCIFATAVTAHCHCVSLTERGLPSFYPSRIFPQEDQTSRAGCFITECLCHYPCIPAGRWPNLLPAWGSRWLRFEQCIRSPKGFGSVWF